MRGTLRTRLFAPLAALMLSTLSCAVVPVTPSGGDGAAAPLPPVGAAPPSETSPDPVVEAVYRHLEIHRQRSGLTLPELARLAETIVTEARRHDLDPGLVLAVMHVESRFNAFAVSSKDALGLMQILPSTGEWLAGNLGIQWKGPQTLFDPIVNTRLGVAYLRQLTDRYGSLDTALSAYNWGPGRIDRRLRRGVPLPTEYAQLVRTAYGTTGRSS